MPTLLIIISPILIALFCLALIVRFPSPKKQNTVSPSKVWGVFSADKLLAIFEGTPRGKMQALTFMGARGENNQNNLQLISDPHLQLR